MADDYTPLHRKVELAIADYLGNLAALTPDVVTGEWDDAAPLPRVVVKCSGTTERVPQYGIFDATVEVTVVTSADDDTVPEHHAFCAIVQSNLFDKSAVLTALNVGGAGRPVEDLHIYNLWPSGMETETVERAVRTTLSWAVVAMGKDGS